VVKGFLIAAGLVLAAAVVAPGFLASRLQPKPVPAPAPVEQEQPGRVVLRADSDGHFRVEATIGGRRVPMLVDTGATVVALSYEHAATLGLVSGGDRFDIPVSTANGSVAARRVVLRDVRIGSVRVPDVSALILKPGAMDGSLLGMSFLGRLRRMESSPDRLVLER
jgi:aspartyl protease family protein